MTEFPEPAPARGSTPTTSTRAKISAVTSGGFPPPGWHADPTGQARLRYWDGVRWTDHVDPWPPAGWLADPTGQARLRYWDGTRWTDHIDPWPEAWGMDPASVVAKEAGAVRRHRAFLLALPVISALQLLAFGWFGHELRRSLDDSSGAAIAPQLLLQLTSLSFLAIQVTRAIWLYCAVDSGRALRQAGPRQPGLAAAGWFIPIVNFWWPDVDVKAQCPQGSVARQRLGWWWALWLLQGFAFLPFLISVIAGSGIASGITAALAFGLAVALASMERGLVADVLDGHEDTLAAR